MWFALKKKANNIGEDWLEGCPANSTLPEISSQYPCQPVLGTSASDVYYCDDFTTLLDSDS
jgi:hypothetical protein